MPLKILHSKEEVYKMKDEKKHIDKKWYILILLLVVIIFQTIILVQMKSQLNEHGLLFAFNYRGNCIPDETTAVQYGKIIYKVRTGIDYNDYDFGVEYDKSLDAWNVWLLTEAEKNGDNTKYLDYRGIFIDKDYGTILRDYIQ